MGLKAGHVLCSKPVLNGAAGLCQDWAQIEIG